MIASMLLLSFSACGKTEEKEASATESEVATESSEASKEKVVVDSEKYVTLPDYKTMEVVVAPVNITDEDISAYITDNMLTNCSIIDRPVQEGDIADIDYEGRKDGVAFEGGSDKGYKLTIGSGQFIEGFEDGLIGVSAGETVDLNLTFPEQYPSEELAGQDVVFTVTVNGIKGKTDYENLTDEQLKEMELGYDTKEALWDAGEEACLKEADENHKMDVQNAIYDKLSADTTFSEIPQELIDEKAGDFTEYMENMCKQYFGCDLETYLVSSGQSMDEYQKQVNEMATESAKQEMIFDAIAKAESISITDDDVLKKAEEMAADYQYESAEAFLEAVGKEDFSLSLLQQKVMEFLEGIVTVKEQ